MLSRTFHPEEESLTNYFCDIECLRPWVTAITECYNAESAVGYLLLCSKNKVGTICANLSQLSSEGEDRPYDNDISATFTTCIDFFNFLIFVKYQRKKDTVAIKLICNDVIKIRDI